MSYQPSSKVLFLTICSLTKTIGGGREYDESEAITSILQPRIKNKLIYSREKVCKLVVSTTDNNWQGIPLSKLEYNRTLVEGADFGGCCIANYLPAIDRYNGRFFLALGAKGKKKLEDSNHHMLLLSGLYGLLRPLESIQIYSCPLVSQVANLWQNTSLLTDIMCDYIREYDIQRIFDLTAVDAYRKLIDWERINRTDTDVLHCFDTMSAGDYALIPFGKLLEARLLDMSEDDLLALEPESRIDNVIFRSLSTAQPGLPDEIHARMSYEKEEPLLQSWSLPVLAEVLGGGNPDHTKEHNDIDWRFAVSGSFSRDLRNQSNLFTQTINAIIKVCRDPETQQGNTVRRLRSYEQGWWRYRIGGFRLVYRVDRNRRTVFFHRLAPRSNVYE